MLLWFSLVQLKWNFIVSFSRWSLHMIFWSYFQAVFREETNESTTSNIELVRCKLTLFYEYWQMNEVFDFREIMFFSFLHQMVCRFLCFFFSMALVKMRFYLFYFFNTLGDYPRFSGSLTVHRWYQHSKIWFFSSPFSHTRYFFLLQWIIYLLADLGGFAAKGYDHPFSLWNGWAYCTS